MNNHRSLMNSWLYIIIGTVLLIFSLDIMYKILLFVAGVGLILYGITLRGFNSRYITQHILMRFFR